MPHDATQVWDQTAAALSQQVSDTVWSSTFQDVQCLDLTGTVITLTVPSQLVRQRIEQRYRGLVDSALADAGYPDLDLVLEVQVDDRDPEPDRPTILDLGDRMAERTGGTSRPAELRHGPLGTA